MSMTTINQNSLNFCQHFPKLHLFRMNKLLCYEKDTLTVIFISILDRYIQNILILLKGRLAIFWPLYSYATSWKYFAINIFRHSK